MQEMEGINLRLKDEVKRYRARLGEDKRRWVACLLNVQGSQTMCLSDADMHHFSLAETGMAPSLPQRLPKVLHTRKVGWS